LSCSSTLARVQPVSAVTIVCTLLCWGRPAGCHPCAGLAAAAPRVAVQPQGHYGGVVMRAVIFVARGPGRRQGPAAAALFPVPRTNAPCRAAPSRPLPLFLHRAVPSPLHRPCHNAERVPLVLASWLSTPGQWDWTFLCSRCLASRQPRAQLGFAHPLSMPLLLCSYQCIFIRFLALARSIGS
jgi:hypothetical protein